MIITLSPELESFIKSQIDSGVYTSVSEVVSNALKLLEERERKLQLLRSELQKGSDQIDTGDYDDLGAEDLDEFFEGVKQRGREKLKVK
jgi:antitoxin ParD1/3/4